MKALLLSTVVSALTLQLANAQDCAAVMAENKKLKVELAVLKGNSTEKGVSNPFAAQTQTDKNLSFKVVSAVGDKRNQTVTVVVMVTNKGANIKSYNTRVISFIDGNGEEFNLKSAMLGKSSSENGLTPFADLYTNVPLKTVYVFEDVLPRVSKIKVLPLPYMNATGGEVGKVEFRDLSISWK